ncbi:MAG: TonB-dependent receptor [Myxococcales bacterium]|nr:TonB-dependent receptor [Myxococcales bacterium]
MSTKATAFFVSILPLLCAPARAQQQDRPSADSSSAQTTDPGEAASAEPPDAKRTPEDDLVFSARAEVQPRPAGSKQLPESETRDVAGALGDPIRMVESLPGVAPVASGLPYGYVRGAPPATVGYYYDEIPLPLLYHFALGPSAIHPRMLGPLSFHAGVPPARFGRRLGGSLAAQGPAARLRSEGELELRLLDANAYLATPLGDGNVAVAGRYGYPGLVLDLISPKTTLAYWDYQARMEHPLGGGSRVQLVSFGSFDKLENPPWNQEGDRFNSAKLQFHRLELRLLNRDEARGIETGLGLRVGHDQSTLDEELAVEALSLGPRLWFNADIGARARLRLGADFQASLGSIDSLTQNAPLQVGGRRQLRVDLPIYAEAAARSAGGIHGELQLAPLDPLVLDLGLRWDLWLVEGEPSQAVDPRLRATYHLGNTARVHAAVGLAHQPAVYLFPLPGLTEVALDRGLQRSLQSELGYGMDLPLSLEVESQLFYHHYTDLLLPELYAPDDGDSAPSVDASSYGIELFVRRSLRESLSGFISYTLAWAEAHESPGGRSFSPEFDIRHVLNLVAQYRFDLGLTFGGRLHARSGRPFNRFDVGTSPTYELRLPPFVRLDARLGYNFSTDFAQMHAYVEWLNVTLARERLGAECFFGSCQVQTAPPIYFPNLGVRAEF